MASNEPKGHINWYFLVVTVPGPIIVWAIILMLIRHFSH